MSKIFLIIVTVVLAFSANSQTICKRTVADFGTFPAGGYLVEGSATLIDSLGNLYLTLSSDFNTLAGPDLYLYLSINDEAPTVPGNTNLEVAFLISNTGTQSYLVPGNYDINDFDFVLVHCKQFDHLWDGGALGTATCNTPTGIIEGEASLEKLIVKKNASGGVLKIELVSPTSTKFKLKVYNVSGQLIYNSVGSSNTEINIGKSIPKGVFFIEVILENKMLTEKIIKS